MSQLARLFLLLEILILSAAAAEGPWSVDYPASHQPGELSVPATFHLWVPPKVTRVRAILVHQHGCGDGAERSGETAFLDLHWQALAIRHQAAILSPHYRAGDQVECRLWCDPRNGSDAVFQRALQDLAQRSGHPEVATAPWCLWGHSGGGFWASLMLAAHPDRIVAIFCRSGAATSAWKRGEIPKPQFPDSAFGVPICLNPGLKERDDARFSGAWVTTTQFFELLRTRNAPAAFAPDPLSGHDCRNSRLLAIPFFDACLRLRLPKSGNGLRPLRTQDAWTGTWENAAIRRGPPQTPVESWLPDKACALAFAEYERTGKTADATPPRRAPAITQVRWTPEGIVVDWTAEADFESGIRQFVIYRDGTEIARLPEKPDERTGFAQFQGLSYHDTPVPNPPVLRYTDAQATAGTSHRYSITTINGSGLEGPHSRTKSVPPRP